MVGMVPPLQGWGGFATVTWACAREARFSPGFNISRLSARRKGATYQSFGWDFRARSGQWVDVLAGASNTAREGARAPQSPFAFAWARAGGSFCGVIQ
jgi:hypothetical protein